MCLLKSASFEWAFSHQSHGFEHFKEEPLPKSLYFTRF